MSQRRRHSPLGTDRTNNNVMILVAVIGVIGTISAAFLTGYFTSQSSTRPFELMINATLTKESILTALVPTSTNTPTQTVTPLPKQPFDVAVAIDGYPQSVDPFLPIAFPALKEVSITAQLTDNSIDHCDWKVDWELTTPTPEPLGCTLTIPAGSSPTFGPITVTIFVNTTDGKSLKRSLTFMPQP